MKLYNSLTHQLEEFVPRVQNKVGMYSCGPTVYWNQHIGHMYAYVQWDILVRFLRYQGNEVTWAMNVTDVGHLTSDADTGEDKMEKGAKRENLSVWDVAQKYIAQFEDSLKLLNIVQPDKLMRATDYIDEQIKIAQKINDNGFAYETRKGLVFDTSKFQDYSKFANLKLDKQKKRVDVTDDPEKKYPWDFYLWAKDDKHIMKWDSPWGVGYPGWHLECTAMSTLALGETFDIHTGGIDHIGVHHTNEIAQGVGAFGQNTANYWLHNAWLLGKGGEKMSKSLGNFITIQELVEKGYNPMALRYLFLTSHYRKGLNFTLDALNAATTALNKLRDGVLQNKVQTARKNLSPEKLSRVDDLRTRFEDALANDLNTPQALAVVWEMMKSNIASIDKYELALSFDEVLGLNLSSEKSLQKLPNDLNEMALKREELRKAGNFIEADKVRKEIEKAGYKIRDNANKSIVDKQ